MTTTGQALVRPSWPSLVRQIVCKLQACFFWATKAVWHNMINECMKHVDISVVCR